MFVYNFWNWQILHVVLIALFCHSVNLEISFMQCQKRLVIRIRFKFENNGLFVKSCRLFLKSTSLLSQNILEEKHNNEWAFDLCFDQFVWKLGWRYREFQAEIHKQIWSQVLGLWRCVCSAPDWPEAPRVRCAVQLTVTLRQRKWFRVYWLVLAHFFIFLICL